MLKVFTFWNRPLDMDHRDAVKRWENHVPKVRKALGAACPRYITNTGTPADFTEATADVGAWPEMVPPYDGMDEAYLDVESPERALTLLRDRTESLVAEERTFVGQKNLMVTDEHIQKDIGRPHRGVKFFVLLTRRRDEVHEQCAEHWLGNHGPLVVKLLGSAIARYSINLGQPAEYSSWSPTEAPPFDGLAEFSMDCSFEELRAMIANVQDELIADEHRFIGTYRIINVDERVYEGGSDG